MGELVSMLFGAAEALIGLRIVLQLLGVNPTSQFAEWIYTWSTPLVKPFAGLFGESASVMGSGAMTSSVFDWTAVIALIVYGLIGAIMFNRARRT